MAYPIAYQLYSSRNFPPLLDQLPKLKAMGYDAIEPWLPAYEEDPKAFRRALDDAGLKCFGFHMPLAGLVSEPQRFIEIAQTLGATYLIPPYVTAEERRPTADYWRGLGEKLAKGAEAAGPYGLAVAWHNHDFEFVPLPDGQTLAYVAVEQPEGERMVNVFTIPASGGPDTRLTRVSVPNDGPEYSPDGQWIYFNSERAATKPGHAQIFRMRTDGTGIEQLTFDNRVNWFPHLSPDGRLIAYLSYPEGTLGHPPDKEVLLRLMSPTGADQRDLAAFFGGQGTINVNSWAPDSGRLAFVSYPLPL